MISHAVIDRARLREPGSVILREFRAAMEYRRLGGVVPRFDQSRKFNAAEAGPLTAGWSTWDASINLLLQSARPILVARSRNWSRNTGPGRRFLELVRNGAVGPSGYKLNMRCGDWQRNGGGWVFRLDKLANDAIEAAWNEWCKRGNCEASGRLSFADVCKLQIESVARDGEYLARHLRGADANRWRYQLQLLSADRLDHNHNTVPLGDLFTEVRMGVHRDSYGKPTGYTILKWNPTDARGQRQADIVPASDVLHDFVSLDPEQARGVPWSHAILLGSNMLATFEDYAVFAAQVGASQQGFITQALEVANPIGGAGDLGASVEATSGDMVKELKPGAIDWLPPGADYKHSTSQYPSETFDPFVSSRKRDIASGLSVAYHNLTGDMTDVNYSSARIAELAERDHWRGVSHWFIGSFVEPVFRSWLEMSLLAGQITLPGGQTLSTSRIDKYLAGVVFQGRGWDWVDPAKEVSAAKEAVAQRFTTRSQVVASKGGDYEDNCIEIAQEILIEAANGIVSEPVDSEPSNQGAAKRPQDKQDPSNED